MWGNDLRDILFVPHKSACPLRLQREREYSFIHLFIRSFICPTCAYSVQYCAGYRGCRGEGQAQPLLSWSPQRSCKIPESWNLIPEETLEIIISCNSFYIWFTDFFEKCKDAVLTKIVTRTHTYTWMNTHIYIHTKSCVQFHSFTDPWKTNSWIPG